MAILLIVANGCSDDPISPPKTASGVVVVTVDQTSTRYLEEFGFIFTSSLDGSVLDWATWTEPSVFELEIPTSDGDGFYVTQIHGFSQNWFVLETNYYTVSSTNSLDLRGLFGSPFIGYSELRFSNVPPNNGHTLDTGSNWEGNGRLIESIPYGTYLANEPVDILLTINGPEIPRSFQWVSDVKFNSVHEVDLVNLQPMLTNFVQLPASSLDLRCSIFGYKNASAEIPKLNYRLDFLNFEVPTPEEWQFNYLGTGFDGFHFICYQVLAMDPRKTSGTETMGGLPVAIEMPDLDVSILEPSRDGCILQISGEVGFLDIGWATDSNGSIYWNLDGLDPTQPIVLPQLPEALGPLAPMLNRDDFALTKVIAVREINGVSGDGTTPMVTREFVNLVHVSDKVRPNL